MRRYVISFLLLTFGCMLIVVAVNWIVNPYAIFNGPSIDDVNLIKPETATRQYLSKAYQVLYQKPRCIILGTSRALALPDSHPHWSDKKCFNLALSSSSIYEQYRYTLHSHAVHPVEKIVIGLDFFSFNDEILSYFDEDRLMVLPDGKHNNRVFPILWKDFSSSLFTLDAFRSSIKTIRAQKISVSSVEEMARRVKRKGGHRQMFLDFERDTLIDQQRFQKQDTFSVIGTVTEPGTFRKFLRHAYQNNIELHMFISPSHARMGETWRTMGLLDEIEKWKMWLVNANEEEAYLVKKRPFPLWDFDGYNSITTETVPVLGDMDSLMRGYWEDSHYTNETGLFILDRIFDYRAPNRNIPEDFGVSVNGQNITAHLESQRRAAQVYRQGHLEDVQEILDAKREIANLYQSSRPN